jgi:hypothetical protein
MGRPKDSSLNTDFNALGELAGKSVSVKLNRHDGRRNARHKFIVVGPDQGPRGTVRLAAFSGEVVDLTPGNFVNFRVLEARLVPGDFVVDGDHPGRRAVVKQVMGHHALCEFVDGDDVVPAHRLVLMHDATDEMIWTSEELAARRARMTA